MPGEIGPGRVNCEFSTWLAHPVRLHLMCYGFIMKIWHDGGSPSPQTVNGVNTLVYALAREQASLGNEVTLVLKFPLHPSAHAFAAETGVKLLEVSNDLRGYSALLSYARAYPPDVVHMHSVFIPRQWWLYRVLKKLSIPFVVTPSGGYSPQILDRSAPKKAIYSSVFERPRLLEAAAISCVTPFEESEVRTFAPRFAGRTTWIPVTFDPEPLRNVEWTPKDNKTIVYLGRFDVQHKGIDLIVKLAEEMPEVEFHLYGPEEDLKKPSIVELRKSSSHNVIFHDPVFGAKKAAVLAGASLYIQMSRWEAFGISIAEAMYLGLPCALSSALHLAPIVEENDLGLVVPPNPRAASEMLRTVLANPEQLEAWSKKARHFVECNFLPRPVAIKFLDLYSQVIEQKHGTVASPSYAA